MMVVDRLKEWVAMSIIFVFNLLPIKKNKIIIFSYYGSQYGCNPKYITAYLLDHAEEQFDLVWAFNEPDKHLLPKQIRKVKMMSFNYFYELCTAKVIITNYRTTKFFHKRKKQYYIQTWHSSLRLKKIEKDAIEDLTEEYLNMAQKDSLKCDLLLSGCRKSTEIFNQSFWYDGEIFEHGTPRNDLLLQPGKPKRAQFMEKINLSPKKKVILYAPTFRKHNHRSFYNLDFKKIVNAVERKFGGSWVFMVKLHPHLKGQSTKLLPGHVHDVTRYDDIQELLFIADLLITDYSSLMFDFSITKRPCLLYVPDLTRYTNGERGLYFDLEELPFINAYSNGQLINEIKNFDKQSYEQNLNEFFTKIVSYESGQARKKLVERIKEICFEEQRSKLNEAI